MGRGRLPGLGRQADAVQEILKTWVGAQIVEISPLEEVDHHEESFFIELLDQLKRLVALVEHRWEEPHVIRMWP